MLRISPVESPDSTTQLRLEGRVVGPWVTALEHACQQVLDPGRSLELHLAEVEFMDARGVALLASLRSRGVTLLECPPFAAEQLRAADAGAACS